MVLSTVANRTRTLIHRRSVLLAWRLDREMSRPLILQETCSKASFRLHKIISNKKEVLEAFPVDDHSKEIKELNLAVDPLPIERAVGVMWCAESDSFRFRIELHDRPLTRRGVLSTIGSIYDSNGYLAPVTLTGK